MEEKREKKKETDAMRNDIDKASELQRGERYDVIITSLRDYNCITRPLSEWSGK